jgi:hypothetical protein
MGPQEEDLHPCFQSPGDPKDIKNGGQSALVKQQISGLRYVYLTDRCTIHKWVNQ